MNAKSVPVVEGSMYFKVDELDYGEQQTLVEMMVHNGPPYVRQGHTEMRQYFFCWWRGIAWERQGSQCTDGVSKRHVGINEKSDRFIAWNFGSG